MITISRVGEVALSRFVCTLTNAVCALGGVDFFRRIGSYFFFFWCVSVLTEQKGEWVSSARFFVSLCVRACIPTAPAVDGAEGNGNGDIGRELQDRLESGAGWDFAGGFATLHGSPDFE